MKMERHSLLGAGFYPLLAALLATCLVAQSAPVAASDEAATFGLRFRISRTCHEESLRKDFSGFLKGRVKSVRIDGVEQMRHSPFTPST